MTCTCGCCQGIGSIGRELPSNRPGLDAIQYRVGTYASFLDRMIASLTLIGDPSLDSLTTRAAGDPTLALLDAWAMVGDVLTFYQERIANEGYLRTATERRSILELARLVGYELKPGVAASVYLAYTLEQGYGVEIPCGARAQSLPGPGELPQSFETSVPLEARDEWNDLEPRKSRPVVIVPPGKPRIGRVEDARSVETLYLNGTSANVKPNDRILLMFNPADPHPRIVAAAEADAAARRTKVRLLPEPFADLLKERKEERTQKHKEVASFDAVVERLRQGPAKRLLSPAHLNRHVRETFSARADAAPSLIAVANPLLKDTFYPAWANAKLTPAPELTSVDVMRVKAPLFGHNAPLKPIVDSQGVIRGTEEWSLGDSAILAIRAVRVQAGAHGIAFRAVENAFIEVAVRHASESGRTRFPMDGQDHSGRVDGLEVTMKVATEGPPRLEISIVPGVTNTLGMNQKQRIVIAARVEPAEGGQQPGLVIDVSIENGPQKDPEQTVSSGQTVRYRVGDRRVSIELTETSFTLTQESRFAVSEEQVARDARTIALDATYDQIVPGSWVIIERLAANGRKLAPLVSRVADTATLTKSGYGMTAKVTELTLEAPWLDDDWLDGYQHSLGAFRTTTVYAQNDPQQLTEEPIVAAVEQGRIELQDLHHGLASGRWLIVEGQRSDIPDTDGIPGAELVMLSRIEQEPDRAADGDEPRWLDGSRTRSTLILADPLAYKYKRDTVKIYGNVVKATHGETRTEVLGNGDGSKSFQQFTLKQPPLTYVAATSASGVESTLEVRVNEVKWHRADTLVDASPDERSYTTQTDDAGKVTVVFGDGRHGARLPTGLQNVTSIYRSGIGRPGNVKGNQVSLLVTRPLGVKEVTNPLAASGGGDPESRDDARGNVPLRLLALDRLVSVMDYEAFTRAFAGIGKAKATKLSDDRRELVHLTIAGVDDIPVDESSDLYLHLNIALREFGDPQQPIRVESRRLLFLVMSATVALLPDYNWGDVERRLRAALLDAFSFKRRQLGQDVVLSEILSVMHAVPGVAYVDIDVLDAVSESTTPQELATIGAKLTLKQRVEVKLARAHPVKAAELAIFTPDVPDTLILRGPEK